MMVIKKTLLKMKHNEIQTFVSVSLFISTSETQENIHFQAIKMNKKFLKLHTVSVASPLPMAVTWMSWLMSLNCGIK